MRRSIVTPAMRLIEIRPSSSRSQPSGKGFFTIGIRVLHVLVLATVSTPLLCGQTDWPVYGHDAGGERFSSLAQINTKNVARLQRAWTYHMRPAATSASESSRSLHHASRRSARPRASESTPLVVNGVLYSSTAYGQVVALEPETGHEIWSYTVQGSTPSKRGVSYWPGDKRSPARILFGTADGRLIALNANTGKAVPGFGNEGIVQLRAGEGDEYPNNQYGLESPPTIYRDLVITGSNVQETPSKGPHGDVRAWDVRSGRLLWTFHTVPRPGEPGHDAWQDDSWKNRSGANVWGGMTIDIQQGILFLPIGSPSYDFYGADRKGNNLYGDSLVALNASTGKLLWYFQFVHHDIWDYDPAAPPALVDVHKNGQTIPAVVEVTKMGLVFILDRRNGKPIFGVEERPVPKSDVPGEASSPTQPFPLKPPPLSRMSFRADEVAAVAREHQAFCTQLLNESGGTHNDGAFTPYGSKMTVVFPGTLGGANWGGASFNRKLGYLFVNTQNIGSIGQVAKQPEGSRTEYARTSPQGPYGRFWDSKNFWPCQQPPWGELSAVNVNTGEIAWKVPLGVVDELEAKGVHNTGTLNLGGSIATSGGLVFIGATNDSRFRAFDARTGKELWVTKIDASAHTTPITYRGKDGKQYVVVTANGGNVFNHDSADSLIAFSLP